MLRLTSVLWGPSLRLLLFMVIIQGPEEDEDEEKIDDGAADGRVGRCWTGIIVKTPQVQLE